jgi:hypothetical protein
MPFVGRFVVGDRPGERSVGRIVENDFLFAGIFNEIAGVIAKMKCDVVARPMPERPPNHLDLLAGRELLVRVVNCGRIFQCELQMVQAVIR